jgi:succinate dehydrogenase/fumarate reductase flavoprotein subunit
MSTEVAFSGDRFSYDVVVVGAGGSGLRAAIEARLNGRKTAIISKSLFGKAHTVMAEGRLRGRHGQREPERQLAGLNGFKGSWLNCGSEGLACRI